MQPTVALPNSQHVGWPGATRVGPAPPDGAVVATVWLHGRGSSALTRERAYEMGATPPLERRYADRDELARETDAEAAAFASVARYCAAHDLIVNAQSWRSLGVSGDVGAFSRAFGTTIDEYALGGGRRLRRRTNAIHVPAAIGQAVRGVCGLDEWPALPETRTHRTTLPASSDGAPLAGEIEAVGRYGFPTSFDGTGQTIGILRLGGTFHREDFDAGLRANGVPTPPAVHFVHIDDAAASYGESSKLDTELALDTQIVGSLAPGAELVLYAASHGERGFLDAIRTALFDDRFRPTIVSISFGIPEVAWTSAALDILDELFVAAALLGVSIFCASGDAGADVVDGRAHVRAPASSHFVHACGGTQVDAASGSETVWPGSGGGFSNRRSSHAQPPPWQSIAAQVADELGIVRGRGVPDVAAAAAPGYRIVIGGEALLGGGTSAVAPLWAALTARINQRLGVSCGFFAPLLYGRGSDGALCDITQGNNGRFEARETWDPCTGLGTPRGARLLDVFSTSAP